MVDRTRRSAGLMILDIFLQFLPGFMLYHCVSAVGEILLQMKGWFSLWNGLWLFLLTAGFYLFRYYFPDFRLFLISHLIWLVLFCIILPQNIFSKVILTMVGVIRSLYGSIQKASHVNERGEKVNLNKVDMEATDPKEGCVVLASLFLALLAGDISVIYPFLAEPVLFYLAYLLRTHLSGRRLYLNQYEHMSHFPMKHMKQTGYLVMGAYLLISSICLTAAASYRYLLSDTGPFIWLWERIKQIVRFLVLVLAKLIDLLGADIPVETTEETMDEVSPMFVAEAAKTSVFWMLTEQILKIGIFIILIVGLVTGVVYILLEWNRRFQRGKRRGSQAEEYEEIRETWKPKEKQVRKRKSIMLFQTPEEKIRRIYIRAVKKALGQQTKAPGNTKAVLRMNGKHRQLRYEKPGLEVDETLPPSELDQAIYLHRVVENEETLRVLYEKARYSGQSMGKELVIQARAAAAEGKR